MISTRVCLGAAVVLVVAGCAGRVGPVAAPEARPAATPEARPPEGPPAIEPVAITPLAPPSAAEEALPRIGFSIQAGAFADADNAALRVQILAENGLEAFHFAGDDGFHRVRFGSFSSRDAAVERAEALRKDRIIEDYYIVVPEPGEVARSEVGLRAKVVGSAMEFLGTPYRWGGPSADTGFDCSGLTMTAYRLHGLALPRASGDQYAAGKRVTREGLRDADLVFFATAGGHRPSHVGLYIGQGRFIHAPGSGKFVRIDDLSQDYYAQRFLGGRSYLQ